MSVQSEQGIAYCDFSIIEADWSVNDSAVFCIPKLNMFFSHLNKMILKRWRCQDSGSPSHTLISHWWSSHLYEKETIHLTSIPFHFFKTEVFRNNANSLRHCVLCLGLSCNSGRWDLNNKRKKGKNPKQVIHKRMCCDIIRKNPDGGRSINFYFLNN